MNLYSIVGLVNNNIAAQLLLYCGGDKRNPQSRIEDLFGGRATDPVGKDVSGIRSSDSEQGKPAVRLETHQWTD